MPPDASRLRSGEGRRLIVQPLCSSEHMAIIKTVLVHRDLKMKIIYTDGLHLGPTGVRRPLDGDASPFEVQFIERTTILMDCLGTLTACQTDKNSKIQLLHGSGPTESAPSRAFPAACGGQTHGSNRRASCPPLNRGLRWASRLRNHPVDSERKFKPEKAFSGLCALGQ